MITISLQEHSITGRTFCVVIDDRLDYVIVSRGRTKAAALREAREVLVAMITKVDVLLDVEKVTA